MTDVECITLHGDKRTFPRARLTLRPAVYAVIVHDGNVLLLTMRHTGKYHLPGGGLKVGERLRSLGSLGFRRMPRQRLPRASCHNAEKVW